MIYEYAVEPRLIAQWAISGIGRMVGQFGMDQRRFVADFPKDWACEVWGEFYQHFDCDDTSLEFENAKPILDAYLQILAESVIARRAPIESALNWKNAALKEHTQRPFHAILAEADETKNSAVITIDVLDNVRDGRWYLPTIKPSLKTAVDIARAVRPLVARARQIVIIDPYFRAKEKHQNAAANRWVEPLVAILDAALDKREPELGFPKVVVMTGVEQMHDPKFGPFTPQEKANVADNLVREAHQYLSALLPLGLELELVCLSETNGPDLLHNRFLITDIAGVVMPYGADAREDAAIDDIQPMHRGIYDLRWQQYARRKGITVVRSGDIIRSTRTP